MYKMIVLDLDGTLTNSEKKITPRTFEALMAASEEDSAPVQVKSEETLFSDIEYLNQAFAFLNRSESHPVSRLQEVSGLEVMITPDMRKRLTALLPTEAMPQGDYMRLSDDKDFFVPDPDIILSQIKSPAQAP